MDGQLLESNLLRTLIDNLPDLIYVKDRDGRFLLVNASHMRFLGAESDKQILGKTVFDFFPKTLAELYHQDDLRIVESGKALLNQEEPIIDSGGRKRWVSTTKSPLHDSEGRIIGLVGMSRDVTQSRSAREERDRLFALTPDMLCIAGFDGYFKEINPAWERTLGYSKAEMLASPYIDFVHPEDRSATIAEALSLVENEATVNFENRYRCKDGGYKWLLWSASPFSETELIYAAARDITERKQSEDQLRRANTELENSEKALREAMEALSASHEEQVQAQLQLIQAEKMDSVGRLAAGVAHEVKNPLAIMLMGVDYLTNHCVTGNENASSVLRAMRDAIHRADTIVRGLVDFSANRQLEEQVQDVNPVIEQSLLLVKHELLANRVSLTTNLAQALPPVKLDVNKMQQVFVNIFMNAAHAMPDGGVLTVTTYAKELRSVDRDEGSRKGDRFRTGDTVVVAIVEDTGVGVPEDKLLKIFDPFFTTKATGKGTGLGLTVTRRIIELHGGTIDISNREDTGARVTIMFKAREEDL